MFVTFLPAIAAVAALQTAPIAPPSPEAPVVAVSAALRHDTGGRPVISALLDGKGPFDMVVDTAAQTSFLSQRLIDDLGLTPLDETMNITGAVGSAQVALYPVTALTTDLFRADYVALLAMPNAATTQAGGLIGMERLSQGRLVFDRTHARVTLEPSAPAPADFIALKGRLLDNGLLVVPLTLEGVTVEALVDTGAGETLANPEALAALGWADTDPRLKSAGQIRGATLETTAARIAPVSMAIGPIRLGNVPMVFSDFASDEAAPRIILGSNILNLFSAYAVDFSRAELQIQVPPKAER